MRIIYADEFTKQFAKISSGIQLLYRRQEIIFKRDWRDPRLHVKKLTGEPLAFSFRITRNYRVLFTFVEHDTALFATIAHRKDAYR